MDLPSEGTSPLNGLAVRRIAPALTALVLLVAATGCTGSSKKSDGGSDQPSQASTTAPLSAPFEVQVTHVAGELSAPRRRHLVAGVRHTLAQYVAGAFLGGDYPRSDFRAAFSSFTRGTRSDARHDQVLLTNRSLGATTSSVRATRRAAYLSVLAPKEHVAGVTAAVDLMFRVDRGDKVAQRVRLTGRLLMTRRDDGRWAIFGYELNRSAVPARRAS